MMRISIVTVTYNCKSLLETTIQSITNQTYKNTEYIIIDGASTDGTVEIIKRYEKYLYYWCSEKDKGIFDAMNKGIDKCNGDYTIFLNAGDKFANNFILSQCFENKDYDEDLVFGDVYIQNKLGYLLSKANPIYSKAASKKDYVFKGQGICHQALFTKTSLLKRIKFETKFKLGADYDTTAKVYEKGNHKLRYLNLPISVFDDRYGGASHYKIKEVLYERAHMFNYPIGLYYFFNVFNEILKYYLKIIMGFIFAPLVISYRKRKYITHL